MKLICSLDGPDNVGKTTQVTELSRNNPDIVSVYSDLSNYPPFPKLTGTDLFNWWFLESSPQEFCDAIYGSLYLRNLDILGDNAPIVLVDKSIYNFDTRVTATLCQRGMTLQESLEIVQNSKQRHKVVPIEQLRLLLKPDKPYVDKAKKENVQQWQEHLYSEYQNHLFRILGSQVKQGIYTQVAGSGTVSEVSARVKDGIFEELRQQIGRLPEPCSVIGISGLSESGKSSIGEFLSHHFNIWNIKLRYFARLICNKYNIAEKDLLFRNDQDFVALLFFEQLILFFSEQSCREAISVESLHSFQFTAALKELMKNQFKILFVNSSLQVRINRTSSETANLAVSKPEITNLIVQKDKVKTERGVGQIEQIADYVINNEKSKLQLLYNLRRVIPGSVENLYDIVHPKKLALPSEYRDLLIDFLDYTKLCLGRDLKLFLITGGCAREKVVLHWSDIDVILVLTHHTAQTRDIIDRFCASQKLKVGTTVYSQVEAQSLCLDSKSFYYIYNLQQGLILPSFYESSLAIPTISKEEVVKHSLPMLFEYLHRIRRDLYSRQGTTTNRGLMKQVILCMRIYLFANEVNPIRYDYEQVVTVFSQMINLEFAVPRLSDPQGLSDDIKNFVIQFIDYFPKCLANG